MTTKQTTIKPAAPTNAADRVDPVVSRQVLVYTEYHSGDHTPYTCMIRDRNDKDVGQFSELKSMFRDAGIDDGDEFEITIRRTGNRPFENTRIELVKAHTYERVPC